MPTSIPDAVRNTALFAFTRTPGYPPGSPHERIVRDGWAIDLGPGERNAYVGVERVPDDGVEALVEEVRAFLLERGKTRAVWVVPDAALPRDLAHRLSDLGLEPWDEEGGDPRLRLMATIDAPSDGPADVLARPVGSADEVRAGIAVAGVAFGDSEADIRELQAHAERTFELEARGLTPLRTFVAFIQDEVVGCGRAIESDGALHLLGGSTRPDVRGRGVYRALVRARWDAAVARGTPALTVEAQSTSFPILERLGFRTVGEADCLLDRFSR